MEIFSQRLKELRKTEKISQQKLAHILNVSASCIYNWENGYSEPDFGTLAAIAKFFDVTCGYLVGVEEY